MLLVDKLKLSSSEKDVSATTVESGLRTECDRQSGSDSESQSDLILLRTMTDKASLLTQDTP